MIREVAIKYQSPRNPYNDSLAVITSTTQMTPSFRYQDRVDRKPQTKCIKKLLTCTNLKRSFPQLENNWASPWIVDFSLLFASFFSTNIFVGAMCQTFSPHRINLSSGLGCVVLRTQTSRCLPADFRLLWRLLARGRERAPRFHSPRVVTLDLGLKPQPNRINYKV